MTSDSTWDVQSAVFTQLCASEQLTSLLANGASSILEHVQPNTPYPYVAIGDTSSSVLELGAFEVILTLHTYSKSAGMNETKQIMSAICDALHDADFAVPNQKLVMCLMQGEDARLESDGKTRHGSQQFRIVTESA